MKSKDILDILIIKYGQAVLAEKLGIIESSLSKARSGEYGMKLDSLDKAMDLAGVVLVPKDVMEELTRERKELEEAVLTITDRWRRERERHQVQAA